MCLPMGDTQIDACATKSLATTRTTKKKTNRRQNPTAVTSAALHESKLELKARKFQQSKGKRTPSKNWQELSHKYSVESQRHTSKRSMWENFGNHMTESA